MDMKLFSEFTENLKWDDSEQLLIEKLEKAGFEVKIAIKENGIRTITIINKNSVEKPGEGAAALITPKEDNCLYSELKKAIESKNFVAVEHFVQKICSDMGLTVRGVCFSDRAESSDDAILYLGGAGDCLQFDAIVEAIQQYAKEQDN